MLNAGSGIELHVSLRCTRPAGLGLARAVLSLQDAEPVIVTELLSELCNNLLGRAKRAFAEVDLAFTLSLPFGVESSAQAFAAECIVGVALGPIQLVAELGIRQAAGSTIKASALCENMVVVEDILTESGALFVPAGTRITVATAERISRRMPQQMLRVVQVRSN